MSVSDFVTALAVALEKSDECAAARCLSLSVVVDPGLRTVTSVNDFVDPPSLAAMEEKDLMHECNIGLHPTVAPMAASVLKALKALAAWDVRRAHEAYNSALEEFVEKIFLSSQLDADLLATCACHMVASASDVCFKDPDVGEGLFAGEKTAEYIQKLFHYATSATGNGADEKRLLGPRLAMEMMRHCLRQNKAVEKYAALGAMTDRVKPALEVVPKADSVPFNYYAGLLALTGDEYLKAEGYLTAALVCCPAATARNRRRIVERLVPIKMLLGKLPSNQLLKKYGLAYLEDFSAALRWSKLGEFDALMAVHEETLQRKGTESVMHRCRARICRSLVRTTAVACRAPGVEEAGQTVKLADLQVAFRLAGCPKTNTLDLALLLTNVMSMGLINGMMVYAEGGAGRVQLSARKTPFETPVQWWVERGWEFSGL